MYGTLYWVLCNDEQNGHNACINYSQLARENQESQKPINATMFYKRVWWEIRPNLLGGWEVERKASMYIY